MREYSLPEKIIKALYPPFLYWLIQSIVGVAASMILLFAYVSGNGGNVTSQEVTSYLFDHSIMITLLGALFAIPVFYLLYRNDCKRKALFFGVSYTKPSRAQYAVVVLLAISASGSLNFFVSILTAFLPQSMQQSFADVDRALSTGSSFMQAVTVVLAAPVVEELIFRGLLYKRLTTFIPAGWAMLLSGLAFGIYHGNFIQGTYAFVLGVLLAYVMEKYQKILAPVLFHMAANGFAFFADEWGLYSRMSDRTFMNLVMLEIILAVCMMRYISQNVKVEKIEDKSTEQTDYQW